MLDVVLQMSSEEKHMELSTAQRGSVIQTYDPFLSEKEREHILF